MFQDDPVALLWLISAVVLFLVVIGLLVRWIRTSPIRRLTDVLEQVEEVAVLMHPNPDPDAFGAALGVAYLADFVETEATVQYPGSVRHPNNRALRTVLDIDCSGIARATDLTADCVVLVDHNVPRGFDGADRIAPYAVIDHHSGDGVGSAFTDVRGSYGACSTIVCEYLRELGYRPLHDSNEGEGDAEADDSTLPTRLTTALFYGIMTDTDNLTRNPSPADIQAIVFLAPGIDEAALSRIANPQVDAEVLDVMAKAICERCVRPPYAVSDVGSTSNVDAIPQAADELLRLEGVSAVVVLGDHDGNIHLSGRSRDDRVHIGEALPRAVGDLPKANAGGHARMGGGTVSVNHMRGLGPSSGITRENLHDRLFEAMAGER